jgi:hypothetical protein
MRYKVVPDSRGLDTLMAVHQSLPLVPADVENCCVLVVDRTAVLARDDARQWITFLEALELAEETTRGYKRVRTDPEPERLGDAFRRRIFAADELLSALEATESLTVPGAFERLRPIVPQWERDRHQDWETEWRDRTRRLLAWSVVFDLATRDGDVYGPVDCS